MKTEYRLLCFEITCIMIVNNKQFLSDTLLFELLMKRNEQLTHSLAIIDNNIKQNVTGKETNKTNITMAKLEIREGHEFRNCAHELRNSEHKCPRMRHQS